jgi:hypothetical protein
VFAVNGKAIDSYLVVPQRTDAVITRLGLKVLGWMSSPFHGTHSYRLDVHGRALHILHSADGRIKLTLDGRDVYRERKKTRHTREGERIDEVVEEYDQEQIREQHEEERAARLAAVRARLEARKKT